MKKYLWFGLGVGGAAFLVPAVFVAWQIYAHYASLYCPEVYYPKDVISSMNYTKGKYFDDFLFGGRYKRVLAYGIQSCQSLTVSRVTGGVLAKDGKKAKTVFKGDKLGPGDVLWLSASSELLLQDRDGRESVVQTNKGDGMIVLRCEGEEH